MEQADSSTIELFQPFAAAVDAEFYTFAYGELPPGFTASSHYETLGWKLGYDPNAWFSTSAYLEENPDVAEAGIVPLYHFLEAGSLQGRNSRPSSHATSYLKRVPIDNGAQTTVAAQPPPESEISDDDVAFQCATIRNEFNVRFYLALYPDVAQLGVDPLQHFVKQGWREGRDPNASFSTKYYLEENADVAQAGVNPFFHYVIAGRSEGREPKRSLGFRYDILRNQTTLEERLADVYEIPSWRVGSKQQLQRLLSGLNRSGKQSIYVSVSHDDFTQHVGGVQLCLRREASAFARRLVDHIHLFPGRVLLVTDHDNEDPIVGILVNDEVAGYFQSSTMIEVMGESFADGSAWPARSFAIHSFLSHNVRAIAAILRAMRMKEGYFWIHDYASVCAGLQLLRNDVEFCGAPAPGSTPCAICIYGKRRPVQLEDHREFFDEFSVKVVAPSQAALDVWSAGTSLHARGGRVVHSHCRLAHTTVQAGLAAGHRELRVAFLGLPAIHKGWPVYCDLVRTFAGDPRYAFYHLGMHEQQGLPIAFEEVRVGPSLDAMVNAVRNLEIDVAIIWSFWAETFCLTAHEAIAGGAYVIAPKSSGNVARTILELGKGFVLEDEHELVSLFQSGDVAALGRAHREVENSSLEFSEMTADLVP